MNVTSAVKQRYSEGANEVQDELCCPVDYDRDLLKLLPQEIIDKDYGCGDPSRYVREGDVVLDLGSGGGKICYMAAQLVGTQGRVIGVDMNDDMLALASKYQSEMAGKLGGDRVVFHKGYIQDLALDVAAMEDWLADNPVTDAASLEHLHHWQAEQRRERPLIADNSVDLVISNCVLNLVDDRHKAQLIREIHRVLKPGGRVAISDIVSDEEVPAHLKADTELWSGCISGAFQEEAFLDAFRQAGFLGVAFDRWDSTPWKVIEGIEFRSVTLTAVKGVDSPCLDYGHAVMYRGPYAAVTDDEDHVFPRGARMAVCERTWRFLTESGVYGSDFIGFAPATPREPVNFCAPPGTRRSAAETRSGKVAGGDNDCCC
ncbi:MAG TPA: methyltransferase domain-containing protein [Gammaproteobacteria bacterium]|nr:methyltransferase domain-containing protein [Gammaproteobacteria bacterium]